MNTNPTIGIVGGAGPMASALLTRYIIETCQRDYGCKDDQDFPRIILLSTPFAQMLRPGTNEQDDNMVYTQLQDSLNFLINGGANFLAIACNTLHGFIKETDYYPGFTHLIQVTAKYLKSHSISKAMVFGTSTSAAKSVYVLDGVRWPNALIQGEVDEVIDDILRGDTSRVTKDKFHDIIQRCLEENPEMDGIILGCTELSVLVNNDGPVTRFAGKRCIDPLLIMAERLCNSAFEYRNRFLECPPSLSL